MRRASSLFIVVVLALVLTSCYRSDLQIEVNDDGSGTYTQVIAINPEAFTEAAEQFGGSGEDAGIPEDPCEEMQSSADTEAGELPSGVEIEPYRDGDFCGIKFTAEFADVDELEDLFGEISSETESQGFGTLESFTIERDGDGWFFEATPAASSDSSGTDMGMFDDFLEGASNVVRVKLPGKQVEHNADRIDGDGTMIWNLDVLGDTRTLTARTEPGDPITDEVLTDAGEEVAADLGGGGGGGSDDGGSSTVWIILGLVVVAAAVVGFVLWKRKGGGSPTPAIAGMPGASTGVQGGVPPTDSGTYGMPVTPPAAETPTATAAPEAQAAATSSAPTASGPQWDPQRNAYIQWDPAGNRWMQYDDTAKEWKPLV